MLGVPLLRIAAQYMVGGTGLGNCCGDLGRLLALAGPLICCFLGWATMAIAGLVHSAMPGCTESPLARVHFWGHNAGLPVMMAGLGLKISGYDKAEPAIATGSILVVRIARVVCVQPVP